MHQSGTRQHPAIHPAYADLPHIDAVRRWSEAHDGACFVDLADVLIDAGAEKRFAITLLHHHFPVYDHETMLSRYEPEGTLVTTPVDTVSMERLCALPSAWRLYQRGDDCKPSPLEYVKTTDTEASRLGLSAHDAETLSQLGKVLMCHGALNRFGFRLAEVTPAAPKGTVVVETTYLKDRTLELAPEPETTPDLQNAIQTTWQIVESNHPLQGFWRCKKKTSTYCHAYCKTKCRSVHTEYISYHDTSHKGAYHEQGSRAVHYE
jgi:hypothetical protein